MITLALMAPVTLLLISTSSLATAVKCPGVFISEVQEGSHYNKALELYNPLGVVVTLDGWRWGISFNGISTHDSDNISFAKGASIAAYGVYTLCHEKHVLAGNVSCSETSSQLLHNGNDVLRLFNKDGTLVDEFGVWGSNDYPELCGNANGGKDHTIVRKPGVTGGIAPFNRTVEADSDTCSWSLFDVDAFDSAGTHACIANATVTDPIGCGANKSTALPQTVIATVLAILGFSVGGIVLLWGFCTARGRGGRTFQKLSISADSVNLADDDEDWD